MVQTNTSSGAGEQAYTTSKSHSGVGSRPATPCGAGRAPQTCLLKPLPDRTERPKSRSGQAAHACTVAPHGGSHLPLYANSTAGSDRRQCS
jgi:hypothetical protein